MDLAGKRQQPTAGVSICLSLSTLHLLVHVDPIAAAQRKKMMVRLPISHYSQAAVSA